MPLLLGIDTGGTYTDAVLFDDETGVVATAKSLTTRHDLSVGIGQSIDAVVAQSGIAPSEIALVSLSTTLATNALVEGQGGRVCLVLVGFAASALSKYGLAATMKDSPVILLDGGHDAHGQPLCPLDAGSLKAQLDALEGQVSGFAVVGRFAVRNPAHEIAAREVIRDVTGRPVTCSHELSSKLDGPKRALTCVLNARLINLIHHLIGATESLFDTRGIDAALMVVQGDGALISAEVAKVKPIETILSGPAASLVGAAYLTGAKDAVVSDIGGTTTDIAILTDGQPRLDTDGATVGGWRTMVEAVDMHTIGLGGDSDVQTLQVGLQTTLKLGPRRLVPLSLFAAQHADLVHGTLDRQLKKPRVDETDGRFAMAVGRESAHLAALQPGETELLELLLADPLPLGSVMTSPRRRRALDHLVACGLAMVSGLTPSDAAHVLGKHDAWDADAARKAATLFARKKDSLGTAIAPNAEALSAWIIDTLIRTSAETLLETSLANDRFAATHMAGVLLAASVRDDPGRLIDFQLRLSVPLIGLGAAAPSYYPEVADRLRTTALIPEHADVANAIGAVVGHVRVTAEALIAQIEEGVFRLYMADAPNDFTSLDAAVSFSEQALTADARRRAIEAGAGDIEIRLSRKDNAAIVEGREILVDCLVKATASGRPRVAV